jgi:adenylyltransferase/sulfurtransferase
LFVLDALHFEARTLRFGRDTGRDPIRALIDYDVFCGAQQSLEPDAGHTLAPSGAAVADANSATDHAQTMLPAVKEITVQELKSLRENGTPYQLIDVREPLEYEIVHIDGELIPLAEVVCAEERIARDRKVILHCRSGMRSANCIRVLEQRFGFENLYNLRGGVLAWVVEIDSSLPQY